MQLTLYLEKKIASLRRLISCINDVIIYICKKLQKGDKILLSIKSKPGLWVVEEGGWMVTSVPIHEGFVLICLSEDSLSLSLSISSISCLELGCYQHITIIVTVTHCNCNLDLKSNRCKNPNTLFVRESVISCHLVSPCVLCPLFLRSASPYLFINKRDTFLPLLHLNSMYQF